MKRFLILLLAISPLAVYAGDDPHGMTYIGTLGSTTSVNGSCQKCHATHKAAGTSLTNSIANESLCTSCHNMTGIAANFPLENFVKADPVNNLGTSHGWNSAATNAAAGAGPPSNSVLLSHLDSGNVTCSTCHDQHNGATAEALAIPGAAGTQYKSAAVRTDGTGSGTVTYTAAAAASVKAYILEIVEAGGAAGSAKFRLSNDGGVSWFGYQGAWTAYATGNAQLTGSNVVLNDGANVAATFSGNFVIGDRIRFYVSYPFLRVPLDSGDNVTGTKFCRDCHSSFAMDHNAVNTWDGGMKSHPVGITLNANGGGYDRATPLDGDGSSNDGIASNDLKLAADQTVQCLSCHAVHHADSNTTTP